MARHSTKAAAAVAAERRRLGYRRLHLLLKREGVSVNWEKSLADLAIVVPDVCVTVAIDISVTVPAERLRGLLIPCGRSTFCELFALRQTSSGEQG